MTLFLLIPVSQSNCKGPRQADTLLVFSEQYQRQTLYEDSRRDLASDCSGWLRGGVWYYYSEILGSRSSC